MARQLQPSVVYIGDAERTFVKKVPKTDKVMRMFTSTFYGFPPIIQKERLRSLTLSIPRTKLGRLVGKLVDTVQT